MAGNQSLRNGATFTLKDHRVYGEVLPTRASAFDLIHELMIADIWFALEPRPGRTWCVMVRPERKKQLRELIGHKD